MCNTLNVMHNTRGDEATPGTPARLASPTTPYPTSPGRAIH